VRLGDCGARPTPFETHAHARETGIMYGDNRADERAARRLRWVSETARNFDFFAYRRSEKTGPLPPSVSWPGTRFAWRIKWRPAYLLA
jgi:hypothetical protein